MESYFRFTSYGLVATAFLALALTGQLDAVSVVLYAAALGLSFHRDTRAGPAVPGTGEAVASPRWRLWVWRGVAALYLPFLLIDAALLSNRVLVLVHLALFASAMKLLQRKRDRDWVFLYVIAFFMILLAAGLTFNAIFVGSLTLFLFFFVSTLAAFEIRRSQHEIVLLEEETLAPLKQPKARRRDRTAGSPPRRVRYLLGASFAQIVIVASLSLPFFFMIPRFGGGVARGFADTSATGFSDRVELGQVARIKKSQQVVMRVQLDHIPGRYLRWRGVALESYDGHVWSTPSTGGSRLNKIDNSMTTADNDTRVDWLYPGLGQASASRAEIVEQKIILEPIDTPTLFATKKVLNLRGPMSTLFRDLYTDALSTSTIKRRTAYTVRSDVSTPSDQELRTDTLADLPLDYARLYLQPPRRLDPRIKALTHEIIREAGVATPFDKAKAIESYLKTRYGYTLNLTITGDDPLSEFLFDVREGHCEYFATAMVIMLRSAGIPARLINGFQMGEYNDVNRMFTVRESDAHSWVEVYFPHTQSWIEFDPTPAAGINDYSHGGIASRLRKYMDALEVFWLDYIVTLDSDEQASILVSLQRRLAAVKSRLVDYYDGAKQWTRRAMEFVAGRNWGLMAWLKLLGATLLVVLTAAAIYVFRHLKQWSVAPTGYGPWWHRWFILPTWKSRRLVRRDHRECAIMFYEQMLAIASRGGLVKPAYQTPVEFAVSAGSTPIQEITALYNRVRFGGGALDESETRRVRELLLQLKKAVAGRRRRFGATKKSD